MFDQRSSIGGDASEASSMEEEAPWEPETPMDRLLQGMFEDILPDNEVFKSQDEIAHLSKGAFAFVLAGLILSVFIMGFDENCVASIIPVLTDEFHSIEDIGWYSIAYYIPICTMIVFFGKLYTFYSTKKVYITSLIIYITGSFVCAAAPSSMVFILGRAISSVGTAGIYTGSKIIITLIVPLHRQPVYQGLLQGVENIAIAAGPLIAGAVTAASSWRTCFYLSIPVGVISAISLTFFGKIPDVQRPNLSTKQRLIALDIGSVVLLLVTILVLVLAVTLGGSKYQWSNWRIVALLSLFVLLLAAFVALQWYKQDTAMIPPRIIRQRSVLAGVVFLFCTSGALFVITYYLPLYFQAVRDASILDSGIKGLPLVLSLILGSLGGGYLTILIGYYTPSMIFASTFTAIGAGLLSSLRANSEATKWIIFQAMFGLGFSIGFTQPYIAVQIVLPRDDVPVAMSITGFSQRLGNIVSLVIAQNLFTNRLIAKLSSSVPGVDANMVLSSGATDLRNAVDPKYIDAVLEGYCMTLNQVFLVAVVLCCLSMFGALGMQWKSVKVDEK